jgi:membrane-associated phospholipid phosphatase
MMRLKFALALLAVSIARAQSLPADRDVSWKQLIPNILEDQQQIWTFPVRLFQGNEILPTIGFVGITAGLAAGVDPTEGSYFRNTTLFQGFNNVFTGNATTYGMIAAPTLLYAAGFFRKDSKMKNTALLSAEAVADVEIVTEVLKTAASRLRPSSVPLHGNYRDTWVEGGIGTASHASFPSGHTIVAFSIATVISRRYPAHRWLPYLAYGLAGAVGFSRLSLSAHFTSDVFAGAALGYAIARFDVLHQ